MNRISIVLLGCFVVLSVLSSRAFPEQSPDKEDPLQSPHAHGVASPKTEEPHAWKEAELLTHIRQVTFAGRRAGEGYFSPDGSQLIFQSERADDNPFFQIYRMNLQDGATLRISPGTGKTTCAWFHPIQEKVLFASTHEDPDAQKKQQAEIERRASGKKRRYEWDFDEHYDLFEADANGRNLRNLTQTKGYDAEGSWSPNGQLIVFTSNRHAYAETLSEEDRQRFAQDPSSQMDIYLMRLLRADGLGLRRLTTTLGYDGGPFFSPDGKRIVWRRFSPDGAQAEVWTMRIDGTDKSRSLVWMRCRGLHTFIRPATI